MGPPIGRTSRSKASLRQDASPWQRLVAHGLDGIALMLDLKGQPSVLFLVPLTRGIVVGRIPPKVDKMAPLQQEWTAPTHVHVTPRHVGRKVDRFRSQGDFTAALLAPSKMFPFQTPKGLVVERLRRLHQLTNLGRFVRQFFEVHKDHGRIDILFKQSGSHVWC